MRIVASDSFLAFRWCTFFCHWWWLKQSVDGCFISCVYLCLALIDCCLMYICRELYWMTLGSSIWTVFLEQKVLPHSAVEILCVSDQQVQHYRLSLRIRQGQLDPVDVHLQCLSLYSICKRLTSQVNHKVCYATMFQTTKISFSFKNYWHSNQICQNTNVKNIKASKKQKSKCEIKIGNKITLCDRKSHFKIQVIVKYRVVRYQARIALKNISGGNGICSTLHCGIHIPDSVHWCTMCSLENLAIGIPYIYTICIVCTVCIL